MKTFYKFDNKWHKKYFILVFVCIFFIIPTYIFSEYRQDNYMRIIKVVLSYFAILGLLGIIFFTEIIGEDSFLYQFKNDKIFRKKSLLNILIIIVLLGAFFFFL